MSLLSRPFLVLFGALGAGVVVLAWLLGGLSGAQVNEGEAPQRPAPATREAPAE